MHEQAKALGSQVPGYGYMRLHWVYGTVGQRLAIEGDTRLYCGRSITEDTSAWLRIDSSGINYFPTRASWHSTCHKAAKHKVYILQYQSSYGDACRDTHPSRHPVEQRAQGVGNDVVTKTLFES